MEMKWKIGSVEMENPFILAPMAGVTDLPFRMLCKEQGAGLLCTEMVSAKAISFHNKNTISLMQINPSEHPVSMQIFGSEPDLMAEVAKSIEDTGIKGIWNFAHTDLDLPESIAVENVHLSESLMRLSYNIVNPDKRGKRH